MHEILAYLQPPGQEADFVGELTCCPAHPQAY